MRTSIIRFYIPGVEQKDLFDTWDKLCERFGSPHGYKIRRRHVKSVTYHVNGQAFKAEVGFPAGSERILVICELLDSFVCVSDRAVSNGEPLRIPKEGTLDIEYFE
ncbi:MAG: hypothetical protein H7Y17_00320 [Chlorobia bacterium]|nr:hypothetical protein [Fimbriimonadaceae bacterium]